MASPDVLVVGGGSVGAACAYELARRGAAVTLLEREPDVALGCSCGNAGLVGAGIALPLATPSALAEGARSVLRRDAPFRLRPRPALLPWLLRFALACRGEAFRRAVTALAPVGAESFAMHLDYEASGMELGTLHRGAVLTWETESAFVAGVRELREAGAQVTPQAGAAMMELEPNLTRRLAGAVIAEDVGHCDSGRWTRGVVAAARELGANVRTGTPALRLIRAGGRVKGVDTPAGQIHAQTTVVAAGIWSDALLGGVGLQLRLEAGKGYHVDLAAAASDPGRPVYMQEAHVVATPLQGRLRLAGTLDLAGPTTAIERNRTDAILRAAARNLEGIGPERVQELWAGLRPCTADGMPAIGATRTAEGLLIATGHAMIGLTLAPVTGKLVAELAAGGPPSHDLSAFDPDRF